MKWKHFWSQSYKNWFKNKLKTLNGSVRKETELVALNFKKCPGQDGFIGKPQQTFKEKSVSTLDKLFQKMEQEKNTSQLILWDQYYPETKMRWR